MSLIADDDEDYENSDAEQVAMLSWTYGHLRLKERRCNWLDAAVILYLCVFACVTEVHVIKELSELSEMFVVNNDNYIYDSTQPWAHFGLV